MRHTTSSCSASGSRLVATMWTAWARGGDRGDQVRRIVDDVLAVVEQQQHRPLADVGSDAIDGDVGGRAQADSAGRDVDDRCRIHHRRQVDPADPVPESAHHLEREFDRQSGLAAAAGADDADDAVASDQVDQCCEIGVATDERGVRHGQQRRGRLPGAQRRKRRGGAGRRRPARSTPGPRCPGRGGCRDPAVRSCRPTTLWRPRRWSTTRGSGPDDRHEAIVDTVVRSPSRRGRPNRFPRCRWRRGPPGSHRAPSAVPRTAVRWRRAAHRTHARRPRCGARRLPRRRGGRDRSTSRSRSMTSPRRATSTHSRGPRRTSSITECSRFPERPGTRGMLNRRCRAGRCGHPVREAGRRQLGRAARDDEQQRQRRASPGERTCPYRATTRIDEHPPDGGCSRASHLSESGDGRERTDGRASRLRRRVR